MFALILGAVGLLGGGGIAALVAKFGFKLVFGTARSYASKVPPKVWYALAIAAALLGAYFRAHNALKAADAAGYARAKTEDAALAAKIAARARAIEARSRGITQKIEVQYAKDNIRVSDAARALRLRPPPRAVGFRVTGSAMPGFPGPASGSDGAAPGTVSGLAQIPWLPLIDHGELCDIDRAKLTALQSWITLQRKAVNDERK